MRFEELLSYIDNHEVTLIKANCRKLENKANDAVLDDGFDSYVKTDMNVINQDDDIIELIITTEVGFKPSVFFELYFEHHLEVELNEKINYEFNNDNSNVFYNLIGSEVSLLVGILTDKIMKSPLIIPPTLPKIKS